MKTSVIIIFVLAAVLVGMSLLPAPIYLLPISGFFLFLWLWKRKRNKNYFLIGLAFAISLPLYLLISFYTVFYLPRVDMKTVQNYILPNGEIIQEAIKLRSPQCTNIIWDANDLGVFADVYCQNTSFTYRFCVANKKVAPASTRTEKAFPEISLNVGGTNDNDGFYRPFMRANRKNASRASAVRGQAVSTANIKE